MKQMTLIAAMMGLVLAFPHILIGTAKAHKNPVALSADEIAVYRALLRQYASDHSGSLNVSLRTYPLDPDSHSSGPKFRECVKDIELENLHGASNTYHDLTPEVLVGKNMRLVDPDRQAKVVRTHDPDRTIGKGKSVDAAVKEAFATGLFSLSEIAFDKDHRNALVSYSFWCGALCGHGYTLMFEKTGNEWKKTDRICGGWIS